MNNHVIVTQSVTIRATLEKAFETYTSPVALRAWYGSVSQLALRPQGHFTHADPSGDVYESGEFLEVRKGELLKFRMEHHGFCRGSEVTVSFKPVGGAIEVSLTHSGLSEGDAAHMRAQWDWALTNFRSFVEEGRVQNFKGWYALPGNKEKYPL